MLYRFPPNSPEPGDQTFLTGGNEYYAKLKIEAKAGKRTVLITEHTLIFVISGIKLLHFSGETIEVTANNVFLLKKGIYVMAEYIEEGQLFEALMLFLPQRLLRSLIGTTPSAQSFSDSLINCLIIPATAHLQNLKGQLRQYFEHRAFDYSKLMPLKQQEALVLLQATSYRNQIQSFVRSVTREDMVDMNFIVRAYLLHPITIAEMANLCNRSLATFKRDFQKYYSATPRAWINRQRLEHARLLLDNTDKSVIQISNECGFKNVSYFIRLYKSAYHCTPGSSRANPVIF